MAEYKQKDQTFKLWKNDYKKEGDNKPDYSGSGLINGEEKQISLWINQDKNNKRYLSGQIQEPYKKAEQAEKKDSPF
jgi:hypothetical protein|tara:strand:+ start:515 stop:745 length:231 start_codon:yes stop_codon:yes gene_type:complete